MSKIITVVSGGFDPLHYGHTVYIAEARRRTLCDELHVLVDSDEFVAKKHPVMQAQADRVRMLGHLRSVDFVHSSDGPDVSKGIRSLRPTYYCVGPDHEDASLLPEKAACDEAGCKIVCLDHLWKMSSTDLIARVQWSSKNLPVTVSLLSLGRKGVLLVKSPSGWGLPGGFVEPGESLEAALSREVEEETGLKIPWFDYMGSRPGQYTDGRKVLGVYYTSNLLGGDPAARGEATEYRHVSSPEKLSTDCDTWAVEEFFRRYA